MHATVDINGRAVDLELSPAAQRALAGRETPLRVDLELTFACLVRKRVHFGDGMEAGDVPALDGRLALRFRPVTAKACTLEDRGSAAPPPPGGYPVPHPGRMAPRWLRLDYRRGAWVGDFGFVDH